MTVEIVSQQPDQITLQVTISLTGSMLEMEQCILDANNELGKCATQAAIKRFDTDGSPIVFRGPVFPGLLAATFTVLGTSVLHALWLVRVFFVGSIASLSYLGTRLGSRWAGLAAGLLALTAVRIQEWYSVILLDGILAVLLLLTVALAYEASVSARPLGWYAAAGAALGVALLTKEVAVVLLPLPLLVWLLTRGRSGRVHVLGSGVYALASLLVVVPWAIHVYDTTGSFRWLLGAGEQVASRAVASGDGGGVLVIARQYLGMIEPFYRIYVAERFILAPLWMVSWVYALACLLFRPNPARAVLVASAFLFSPIALVTAKNTLRPGQTLFLYLLSCVALAILLSDAATWLARWFPRGGHSRALTSLATVALLAAALTPQVFVDKEFRQWLRGRRIGHGYGLAVASHKRFARKGWVARPIEVAAKRINAEVPIGSVIMSDWHWRASLYFFTRGAHTFVEIPYLSTPPEWPPRRHAAFTLREGEKPLFIFPRKDVAEDVDASLLIFTQSGLLAELDRWEADWVVVTPRRAFLGLFFDASPGFTRRLSLHTDRIQLYERTSREPFTRFPTRIGSNTPRWLEAMRAKRSKTAAEIERFLAEEAGLTEADLDRLRQGGFEHVTTSPRY